MLQSNMSLYSEVEIYFNKHYRSLGTLGTLFMQLSLHSFSSISGIHINAQYTISNLSS